MKRPELSLENRSALITGASGGIGGAIAKTFAAAGAKLFLQGTSQEKLKPLEGKLDIATRRGRELAAKLQKATAALQKLEKE